MEVDDRLRWLEGRVNSSLQPKGEDLRQLLNNKDDRSVFQDFFNNSETRKLFIHLCPSGSGSIKASKQPPSSLVSKSLLLMKCSNSTRITKETLSQDVVYTECSELPIQHLELLIREVYLPLLSSSHQSDESIVDERLLEVLHRLMGSVQVTEGHECGELILAIPSLDILSDWVLSGSQERRVMAVHVMETCVVSWMKQVKAALHFDPDGSIFGNKSTIAGPLAEVEFWEQRLYQLEVVRDQLGSIEVLQILHQLDQAHSTYAIAFSNVHRDIERAIGDSELVLMYLSTLKPWFHKLHAAFSPDTIIRLFPSLIVTLSLVWQHSGFYNISTHFNRLLRLLSNELSLKARDIIGEDLLSEPSKACITIRLALRVCSAFRGHYLDRKDWSEGVWRQHKEQSRKYQQEQLERERDTEHSLIVGSTTPSYTTSLDPSPPQQLCSWPARNATSFHNLNMTIERCNDLLELVQTVEHFSELSLVASLASSEGLDPILTDVYNDFNTALETFKSSTKDLLSIESDGFEKSFFDFRSSVKNLEAQLSSTFFLCFEECSSLEATLRLLESFQGLISRDSVKGVLQPKLDSALDTMHSDVLHIRSILSSLVTRPPVLPNTPPIPTKLIWLKAVQHRVTTPLERVREAAPYLLEGEKGFTLRHAHSELIKEIDSQWDGVINSWTKTAPRDIEERLQQNVLSKDPDSGVLTVNYDPVLEEILRELHYLNGPVLSSSVTIPLPLRSIGSRLCSQSLHSYRSSLEVCVRLYNELNQSLVEETHRSLFTHKLLQLDSLVEEGVSYLNWTSPGLPDFLAKLKGSLTIGLLPLVEEVLKETRSIEATVASWRQLPSLDIFTDCDSNDLAEISGKHRSLVKRLQRHLESSMNAIQLSTETAFKAVEVSWESPVWMEFLGYLDQLVLEGLKKMLLQSLATVSARAQRYEQGGSIPPLVGVNLVLRGKEVLFDPSLSSVTTIRSVPEVVRLMLEDLLSVVQRLKRLFPAKESYLQELCRDSSVQGVTQKLTAHIDTSARQCQSLCKKFTQYGFLWEQDVIATFNGFLMGVAEPHPKKFTRPETVSRTRSASQSAQSRSHSARLNNGSMTLTNSSVMEAVTGVSDWEFLKPDQEQDKLHVDVHAYAQVPQDQQRKLKNPSLEDFDGELAVFQGIIERLEKSPDSVEVGWIKVDQLAIKDSLVSLANKWIYIYTNYLQKKVLTVLSELEIFFGDIEPEVEAISDEEVEPSHIMKLVTILNKVNLQQVMMDGKFGAVNRAVVILEKYKHPLPSLAMSQFEAVPHRWSSIKKRLALSKQRLTPHIQSHSAAITRDLQHFDQQLQTLHSTFLSSFSLSSTCPLATAQTLLKDFFAKLAVLQAQYKDLMELQELLQSAVVNFSLLKQFEEELNTACNIWEERESVNVLQEEWKSQVWTMLDTEEIRLSCDGHMTALTSMGAFSEEWDIRVTLEEEIREILLTIPLVEGLCSPYMRPRHWKQVLKCSSNLALLAILLRNGAVEISVLKEITLGKLMEMRLTAHIEEILAVVERAGKDIAVEELLKNLEEVWLSMTFQFSPHKRLHSGDQAVADIGADAGRLSSTTPMSRPSSVKRKSVTSGRISVISSTPTSKDQPLLLIKNSNDIFDSLDHYQSSLQSLHGSIAASSFKDELQHWHKCLQTVEAVLSVWVKVQTLWVQLEEVLYSGEAAQFLPTQHFMFTSMDKEWKILMKETAKAPNVLKQCLQEDLLSTLEKHHSTLSQCQSALMQYMEGRRDKCSWFYFLQLEDILNLVCYSSRLQILAEYIPKLILCSSGLLFGDSLPVLGYTPPLSHHSHSCPHIIGITGNTSNCLRLTEAVKCDGPVEAVINHLVYSVEMTLNKELSSALSSCLNPSSSSGSVLKVLPSLWTSSYSHQVVIIVTQILMHSHIKEFLESKGSQAQDREHFVLVTNELNQLESVIIKMFDGEDPQDLAELVVIPESTHGFNSESNVLDSTAALRASPSHLLTGESGHSSEPLVNTQQVSFEEEGSLPNITTSNTKLLAYRKELLGGVIAVLLGYKQKLEQLLSSTEDVLSADVWQSVIHYSYSSDTESCCLNGGVVSLSYGLRFTGGVPAVLSPHLEEVTRHLLLTMKTNCFALVKTPQSADACSVISDVSMVCGCPIFPVLCSSDTTLSDLFDAFRGMAATGSWLYLHNIHFLPTPLIQAVVETMADLTTARRLKTQVVTVGGERLREAKLDSAFCIASTTPEAVQQMPCSIHTASTYNLTPEVHGLQIESSLIANSYRNVPYLKSSLFKLCMSCKLSWSQLETVVSRAAEHISNINHTPYGQPIGCTSSSIAQQIIASKMQGWFEHLAPITPSRQRLGRAAVKRLGNISEAAEEEQEEEETREEGEVSELSPKDHEAMLISKMEEVLCLVIAVWEMIVPQLISATDLQSLTTSLEEVFPGMGVSGVLERASVTCEEVSKRYPWTRDMVEALQESRAASVMYSEITDNKGTQFIEDYVLHSCLINGLSPSPHFLHTVHCLVLQLVTRHRVVALRGTSINERGDILGCCVEVLKLMGHSVTATSVPINAIGEDQLLGQKQANDGLLSHLLSSVPSSPSDLPPLHLIVLEGDPTPLLIDTLQWVESTSSSSCMLKCPNMKTHLLDSSTKFLLMIPPHSSLNIGHTSSIPRIIVPSSCSSWCSVVQKSLLPLNKTIHCALLDICTNHLPGVMEFLSPLYSYQSEGDTFGDVHVHVSHLTSENMEHVLEPQDSIPNKLQLVTSMCRILQCILGGTSTLSQEAIERCFAYALIWSFGSALNKKNKEHFEWFIRSTLSAVKSTERGTLWEYKLVGEEKVFELCSSSTRRSKDDQLFVFTRRTAATAELLRLLVSGKVSMVIDGPHGSGKTSFVLSSLGEDDQSISTLHLLMNQQSSTGSLWTQLQEMLTWHSGTTYIPLEAETLVTVVDDAHLAQANDHSASGSILSLIEHHIASGSVHVPNKEYRVSGTVYVCTTDSTQHRLLPDELYSEVVYVHWDQYSSCDLVSIYSDILSSYLLSDIAMSPELTPSLLSLVVQSAVQIHNKMRTVFTPTEERRHYVFTLTTLDSIIRSLCIKCSEICSVLQLLTVWLRETYWSYAARMSSVVDREVYCECVSTAIKKYFSDHPLLSQLLSQASSLPPVDSSHNTFRTQITQTQQHLDLATPTPLPPLYDSIIDIASRITYHLTLPHSLSHVTITGIRELEGLAHIVASASGFSLVRLSQMCCSRLLAGSESCNSADTDFCGIDQFKDTLKSVYSTAAVKNEHILVFIDDHELPGPAHLVPVYQFIKDCSISVDYSIEEKAKLINALRSEACSDGAEFSPAIAWQFFINRVKSNVRVLISLSDLQAAAGRGLLDMPGMLNSTNIIHQLPWDRKSLLNVAMFHLKDSCLPEDLLDGTAHLLCSLHVTMCNLSLMLQLSQPTNKHYQYLVQRFCHELELWQNALTLTASQLDTALSCVTSAREKVTTIQDKLRRETTVMEEKRKSYSQLLVQIGQDMAIAEEQNKLVTKQTERIQHLQQVLPEYEHIYEQYVEELKRIEHDTKDIALNLDQQSLLELRAQTKPSLAVQELLEAVIVIVKSPTADLSWTKGAKRLMANMDRFREMMMEFSHHQEVSEVLLGALQAYTDKSDFTEDQLVEASGGCKAAGQLCAWVLGVESYHKMLQDNIRHLDGRRTHVKASLKEYSDKLAQLQEKVQVLSDRLEGLSSAIEQASIDKSQQEKAVYQMNKELRETERLVQALSPVSEGWSTQRDLLSSALSHHIGPLSVGVSFVTYLTLCDPSVVLDIVNNHLKPCVTEMGFVTENDQVFAGLLNQLSPKHIYPCSKQSPILSTQGSFPIQGGDRDTASDQPDHLESLESSLNKDTVASEHECTSGDKVVLPSQYYSSFHDICSNVIMSTLDPKSCCRPTPTMDPVHTAYSEVMLGSWNKWPLVSDPEGLLKLSHDWTVLDASEWSQSLLSSLEEAVVEGHKVVLTNLYPPFHPALLPLIQAGLQWNQPDTRPLSVEFCGKRIHISRSFRLIMATPLSSHDIPVDNRLLPLNMAPSHPLYQETLLKTAQALPDMFDCESYSSVMEELSGGYNRVDKLNNRLLEQLHKMERGESITVTVDRVEQIMSEMDETVSSLNKSYQSLEPFYVLQSSLSSVCGFGSSVYQITRQMALKMPWFNISVDQYQRIFSTVLEDEEVRKKWKEWETERSGCRWSAFEEVFKECLIKQVIVTSQRVLPLSDLVVFGAALILFSKCSLTPPPPKRVMMNEMQQIMYIIKGEESIGTRDESLDRSFLADLPPRPDVIPDELYLTLYSSPVDSATLETVRLSMIDKVNEWEELLCSSVIPASASLPWKKIDGGDMKEYSLSDLVVLKAISPSSVAAHISQLASDFIHTLSPPSLVEVLSQLGGAGAPLMVLYDSQDIVSQANMLGLEDAVKKTVSNEEDSQSLTILKGGSLSCEELLEELSQCVDGCILNNLHIVLRSDVHCLRLINKLRRLHQTGKKLILTVDSGSTDIQKNIFFKTQLFSFCNTINLSLIPPSVPLRAQGGVVYKLCTLEGPHRYLYTLLLVLSALPESIVNELESCGRTICVLSFLLCALHCYAYWYCEGLNTHLTTLMNCLHFLTVNKKSAAVKSVIKNLKRYVLHQYSVTNDVTSMFLGTQFLESGSFVAPVEELHLPVPSSSVSMERYKDHVIGIIDGLLEQPVVDREFDEHKILPEILEAASTH